MEPDVLIEARREFAGGDPASMAGLSGSEYLPDSQVIRLRYLDAFYDVSFPSGEIAGGRRFRLSQNEVALLLQYLRQASGVLPAGRWISFAELPNGMMHDAPFRAEAIRPLAQLFGDRPQQLVKAAKRLGGRVVSLSGDAGAVIPVFPRILMAVSVWLGDEEFPASASILFDAAANSYLATASLYVLGIALSEHLQQAAAQE